MPLENPNPVVVPQVSEKVFPHLWIYNIMIHAPTTTTGCITIETLPYNATEQSIGSAQFAEIINTSDLWAAIDEVPEAATAMNAIFNAIEPLRTWIAAKQQPIE